MRRALRALCIAHFEGTYIFPNNECEHRLHPCSPHQSRYLLRKCTLDSFPAGEAFKKVRCSLICDTLSHKSLAGGFERKRARWAMKLPFKEEKRSIGHGSVTDDYVFDRMKRSDSFATASFNLFVMFAQTKALKFRSSLFKGLRVLRAEP